jgi:hypothetical protein
MPRPLPGPPKPDPGSGGVLVEFDVPELGEVPCVVGVESPARFEVD